MFRPYIAILRPRHWLKNLFLFAAPFFGGKMFSPAFFWVAPIAFLSFSLCASAVYCLNDVIDIEKDRMHPNKRNRPVPLGLISKENAVKLSAGLAILSFILAMQVSAFFLYYLIGYAILQVIYSLYGRKVALLDLFFIASGFVIRVLAGGEAFLVPVSNWLFITILMISLVLAAGKRLSELLLLQGTAADHRESLSGYSPAALNDVLTVGASASLVCYALYVIGQNSSLIPTVPVVTFGIFRYLMLAKQGKGDPTDALINDNSLSLTVLLWLSIVAAVRYIS
jgi:decaprenyl-phosphate phosphoribosyltransferase